MSEETTQNTEAVVPEEDIPQEDVQVKNDPRASLRDLLDRNGGPSEADCERLKEQFGEVLVFASSEDEVYLFRPLLREEFRALQAKLNDPQNNMDQLSYEEDVCKVCVLWPSLAELTKNLELRGGTASSLAEAIAQNSNFFNPQQIGLLVAKL